MVAVVPVPVIAPGLMVQLPVGKLFNTTEPVATLQVGWVMEATVGAFGVAGCTFTVTLADADVHAPNVAVTVYVPVGAVIVAPDIDTPADGFTI